MILKNGKPVTGIYIGDKAVSKVYHGENLVWQKNQSEEKYLRYWWSGSDPLINGKLVDRMGSGIDWTLFGNPAWTGTEYVFDTTAKYGTYPNCADFNLGHHFKVVLDADLTMSVYMYGSTFLDLGSVRKSGKNIGFFYNQSGAGCNWKMAGDNENHVLAPRKDTTYPRDFALAAGWPDVNLTMEMRDRGNGYDEFFVQDGEKEFTYQADVPEVEYSGFIAGVATLSRGFSASSGIGMKLRSLKIYVYD